MKVSFLNRFILSLILLTPCLRTPGQAQGLSYPDSLERVLAQNLHDTIKINTLYQLSNFWSDRDTLKALDYVHRGIKMSEKLPFWNATGYFYLAGCYFDTDIKRSQKYYLMSDSLLTRFETAAAYNLRSRAWHNYGALCQFQDDEKKFADILLTKAIPLAEKSGDSVRVARNYVSLGVIFSNQLDYRKSLSYFKIAEEIAVQQKVSTSDINGLYLLLELYLKIARDYVFIKDYPNAYPYIIKVKDLLKNDPVSPFAAEYYLIEGMYQAGSGDYKKSIQSFNKGIDLAEKTHRTIDLHSIMFQKYKSQKEMKQYPEAAKTLETLITDSQQFQNASRNNLLHLYHMSSIQALMGNYKNAYDWLMKFTVYSDSAKVEAVSTEIATLEAKYQSTEKEKQILKLQAQNEKAALTIKNNRLLNWLFGSVSLFLLIVSAMAIMFYKNSKKLLAHQLHVHELELIRIKQDQRILMFSSMLEGQEQERTRLARDLHDGLGGLLSGIKIELSQVDLDHPQVGKKNLSRTINHLDQAVNELRRIARSLMPELLMKYGLAEATREFCKSLTIANSTAVVCQVFNYKDDLSKEKQIVLYRIIQELINNALKHANASQVLVLLQQRDDTLFVTVEDDGAGFDTSAEPETKIGAGLANIKARTEFLNGSIDIQSSKQNGTTITIECPVS